MLTTVIAIAATAIFLVGALTLLLIMIGSIAKNYFGADGLLFFRIVAWLYRKELKRKAGE